MNKQVSFGIIGAGAAGRSYVQAFSRCLYAKLVAIADLDDNRAKSVASEIGCQSFSDFENMVRACELDAVIVCTPPVTHPEICIYLTNAKLHVLCEKPISINSFDAVQMIESARQNGVLLTMASKYRFVEDVLLAKKMVSSGLLGDLVLFENVFSNYVDMKRRWNSDRSISGGGVLIDNGTHSVDLMRYFLGSLSKIYVSEGLCIQNLAVEDTVRMLVRSENGVLGSIDVSWSIEKTNHSYLDIYGSRGAISIGWKQSKRVDYAQREWTNFGHGYDKNQAFSHQVDHFSLAIRGKEPLLLTDEEALASVTTIEAGYRAMEQHQHQWIRVTTPEYASREREEPSTGDEENASIRSQRRFSSSNCIA